MNTDKSQLNWLLFFNWLIVPNRASKLTKFSILRGAYTLEILKIDSFQMGLIELIYYSWAFWTSFLIDHIRVVSPF
ncbi:MAG: hypothetical protein RIA69_04495 [Cyclobacteriaceae bacterium]